MDEKTKNAIENLIILSNYAIDNGIASDADIKTAIKSMEICERLIGRKIERYEETEIAGIAIDDFASLIKNKKTKK